MDGTPEIAPRSQPFWLLAVGLAVAGQALLALQLFGPTDSADRLTDDRPIVSGRHPLHLYHGSLGAATFRDSYTTSCYDPQFQAGYPKTPVFDGGSRPAELFLTLGGGHYRPAAYKLGLFALCLLVPVAFTLAARTAGLSASGAVLAAVGGCFVAWSQPVRALLNEGNLDLLLVGLAGLIFLGGLVRYHREPGPMSWLLIAGSAVIGWYAHPVVWLGMMPIVAVFYLATAPRHGPAWHLGLVGAGAAGLAPNLWWLNDWVRFWWVRHPTADGVAPLPCLSTLCGGTENYTETIGPGYFGWFVVVLGLIGILAMLRSGLRLTAGLIVAAVGLTLLVSRIGATWSTVQMTGAERIAPMAGTLLVIPAAYLISLCWDRLPIGRAAVGAVAMIPLIVGWAGSCNTCEANLAPMPLGLNADQEQLVQSIREHTTPDARILIEDSTAGETWNWTALLPVLTQRAYLGGLDPEGNVDHVYCGMRAGTLNGRPFADWTPLERAAFCKRYNVGWVVCRTPASTGWWGSDPTAREVARTGDNAVLFALDRPHSFALSGSATVERADRRQIVLTDVTPNEAGEVVLSFHHIPGLKAAPAVVWADATNDLHDPVPMTRLRLPGPVSRVTLTWEDR